MKPIRPQMIINIDASSMYAYEGVVTKDSMQPMHRWTRVIEDSIVDDERNTSSYWKDDDDDKSNKNGIRVKYTCGIAGCGSIFPIVMQFSGLSEQYMPEKEFVVLEIPGLCVNGHLDLRSEEIGYVCFMRRDCKQLALF